MKKEEIDRLLDKYYSGESTEEEERTLMVFFNEEIVPEGYETEKEIFSYFMSAPEIPEPSSDLESRIIKGIDRSEERTMSGKIRRLLWPSLSTAAAIIILMGSYFFFTHSAEPVDTFSDPRLAYAETMKILVNVSSQLNNGARALESVGKINELPAKGFKTINRSARIAEKNLKNLDHLQKIFEITNMDDRKSNNK